MSVDPQRDAPVAPTGDQNTAALGDPAPTPAPVTPVAPAAAPVVTKAERDRLAAEGRRRAQLEQELQQQRTLVGQLTQQVTALGAQFSASEQRRIEEQLSQLPLDERAIAEVRLLKERIAGMQSRPTPVATPLPQRPQPDVAYTEQKSQEIISAINAELGVTLTGDEAGLDWDSERTFELSARLLAMQQRTAQPPVTPDRPSGDQGAVLPTGAEVPAKKDDETSEAAITARVTEQIRRDLGISSPAAPQPTGSRSTPGIVTEEDLQKTVSGYNSKQGPGSIRAKLKEQRDAAAKAAGVS